MPVARAVRERCRGLMEADEEIRYVFPATLSGTPGPAYFLVVVGDRRILVLATRYFDRDTPIDIYQALPRRTRLGPVEFGPMPTIRIGATHFNVNEEYLAVVTAADAEVFAPETLPLDPLPDL
ncbi:hypothetical protein SAMN05421505_108167 [Sinosporangium album]|uniref:Uncharacterized protein n=1 Tax=Sinosporangium album TaxID=504805 RepID=A0A1G7XFI9_9ACTN|nr:hypothetical protein [Sinosporangium album]SDG82914.1 hypothetical protein SAMN05421505_108167 [Sinosporangium album]